MAVREALEFIERVRSDRRLRAAVEELAEMADSEGLRSLAARHGLSFDLDELREAHRVDWQMRARYLTARRFRG